jgi:phenylalanine-4-hydroxylase
LGVSDAEITRLATVYWFSLEFGLCREADGQLRAYGAGLLSSYGELQYALGNENENGENKSVKKPELRPFEPLVVCEQPYPITTYQPVYFVADSFERAQQQMLEYIQTRA